MIAEQLKLDNQICFPIYSLAKEIINRYRPFLEELQLTYPQYLAMLILWQHKEQTVSQLGHKLGLDSGTLTPLLKRLEQKGLVLRVRSHADERVVMITQTPQGEKLSEKASLVPAQLLESLHVSTQDLYQLKTVIDNILKTLNTK